jgi:transposase-like protein
MPPEQVELRQVKYLNNLIEQDRRITKRLLERQRPHFMALRKLFDKIAPGVEEQCSLVAEKPDIDGSLNAFVTLCLTLHQYP